MDLLPDRVCENCRIRKPIADFYERKSAIPGSRTSRLYICKVCNVELHFSQECRRQIKRDRLRFLSRVAETQRRLAVMLQVIEDFPAFKTED